jgi:hypothetical protein
MSRSALIAAAFLSCACTNIGDFSTGAGECYRGQIVDAPFILAGFEAGTVLSMTFNTDALADGEGAAGVLWTSDGRFHASSISQMEQLSHDSLSEFQFPGGRIRNYLVYAVAADGVPAMVVISLMENGLVEARVMRQAMSVCPLGETGCASPVQYEPLFGLFRLDVDDACAAPDPLR